MTNEQANPGDSLEALASMNVMELDELLKPLTRSFLVSALAISLAAHAAVIGLTSFGLFGDWSSYGFIMPAEIKDIKKEERIAQQRKDAERAIAEQSKAAKAAAKKQSSDTSTDKPSEDPKDPAGLNETEKPIEDFDFKELDLDF